MATSTKLLRATTTYGKTLGTRNLSFMPKFNAQTMYEYAENTVSFLSSLTQRKVGDGFVKESNPSIFLRVDGRPVEMLKQHGGFVDRWSEDQIRTKLTDKNVIDYQTTNQPRFSWGGVTDEDDAKNFINSKKNHTQQSFIYIGPHNKITNFNDFKAQEAIESTHRDYENEAMPVGDLSFEDIHASISPDNQRAFLEGEEVPETIRKEDIKTPDKYLNWLRKSTNSLEPQRKTQAIFKNQLNDLRKASPSQEQTTTLNR